MRNIELGHKGAVAQVDIGKLVVRNIEGFHHISILKQELSEVVVAQVKVVDGVHIVERNGS